MLRNNSTHIMAINLQRLESVRSTPITTPLNKAITSASAATLTVQPHADNIHCK